MTLGAAGELNSNLEDMIMSQTSLPVNAVVFIKLRYTPKLVAKQN